MKKIIILIVFFLFTYQVEALSLEDIKDKLESTSTYQMYQSMGDTSISVTKNALIIKYPSSNPENNKLNVVKYTLEDNVLKTSFLKDINNRYDVLDNSDYWTLELIDIVALSNGNTNIEIKSINKSYLMKSSLLEDKIYVKYQDYDIVNLNGEEETGSLITDFKINLDYYLLDDKIDKETSFIKLVKVSKNKIVLGLTSTLDNATCTLYYKDNLDDILYTKIDQVNCGKNDKDTKISLDIKDSTKTYYFISYLDNHSLESDVLEVNASDKNYYSLGLLLGILFIITLIFKIIKSRKDRKIA